MPSYVYASFLRRRNPFLSRDLRIVSCVLAGLIFVQLRLSTMKIPCLLSLLASTAFAFAPTTISSNRPATQLFLHERVEEAIAEAYRVCGQDPGSRECAVCWDIVSELQAAESHRGRPMQGGGGAVNMSPDGQALMSSFNILLAKIDGKMDQALATTEKLAELGLRDPEIADLHQRAYEMKEAVWNARRSLGQ